MQSVLGKNGYNHILSSNLEISKDIVPKIVTTADGKPQPIVGTITLPICLNNKTENIDFLIVPSICQDMILGVDFCKKFNLNLNFCLNSYEIVESLALDEILVKENFEKICIQSESDLTREQRKQLDEIVLKFNSLVSDKLGMTDLLEHEIITTTNEPFRKRPFLLSPYMQNHLNAELDKLLELGVIKPSNSPYCANVLLVKKDSGELRMCYDGRPLNAITVKNPYPLPSLTRILDKIRDAQYLSSIDLKHAFWQIRLSKDSGPKTAFSVIGRGHFEFVRMPFGLCNAAQTMQKLMDRLFPPSIENNIFVYLDDLVVVNSTFSDHITTLNKVFDTLKSAGLTINSKKCQFCKPSLAFLGYVVDKNGLHANPDKVKSICDYPQPQTFTQVKRFIGMASWYRRFIKNFSELIIPLNNLIKGKKKRQKITWNNEADIAFNNIKQHLISTPILRNPDFSKMFTVQTDASNYAIGAVLTQGEGEDEHVICYTSRTLNKSEVNYTCTEKECLAIVHAVLKFRSYIEGVKFRIVTDHHSLLWLYKIEKPIGRLCRWAILLSQFDYEIIYRPGKSNVVPDALSRSFPDEPHSICNLETKISDKWYLKMLNNVSEFPEKYPLFFVEKNILYKHFENPTDINTNLRNWKQVVPKDNRINVLKEYHDSPFSAHFGFKKTFNRIFEEHWWPSMRQDIKKYIAKCQICHEQKAFQFGRMGLMGAPKSVSMPFQLLSIDIQGPFPKSKSGHSYLLVVVDWFTKFTFIKKLRRALSHEICTYLAENVFAYFGVPQTIIVDNGSQFISKEFKKLLNDHKISNVWYNARYHPQTNNVERSNRVIGTAIRSYIKDNNHRDWDVHVHKICNAINTAVHDVTGFSPAFLVFGRNLPIFGDYYGLIPQKNLSPYKFEDRTQFMSELSKLPDLYKMVEENIKKSYQRNKHYYNLRKRHVEFETGDTVYKRNHVLSDAPNYFSNKLAKKYIKCKVHRKISPIIYELLDEDNKNIGRYHIKDLKPTGTDSDDEFS